MSQNKSFIYTVSSIERTNNAHSGTFHIDIGGLTLPRTKPHYGVFSLSPIFRLEMLLPINPVFIANKTTELQISIGFR